MGKLWDNYSKNCMRFSKHSYRKMSQRQSEGVFKLGFQNVDWTAQDKATSTLIFLQILWGRPGDSSQILSGDKTWLSHITS